MGLTQDNIRENYLKGVRNLIGSRMVDGRMENFIYTMEVPPRDSSTQYYFLTRMLINEMSSRRCGLSNCLRDGLAETIAVRIADRDETLFDSDRRLYNEHWLEYQVASTLVDVIGEKEGSICALKKPDLLGELLHSVEYQGTNLLDFLNRNLDKASRDYRYRIQFGETDYTDEALDCFEAISDCSDKLQLPRERFVRQKVLSRIKRCFTGKENEKGR